ncbi:hypothetical protein ERE_35260 [Agathobacter rectalis M104/1]|uniref:hypothetical protein n=1 Tax=Agathobacter rectalis TaxID=39491 RepID=UPI0001CD136D|nr:hypothetical protein [Agathobacter rectalis]CBK95263.1 hypothetical protein ERE_35260 [Agathobacter rectalis M104/1]
MANTTNATKTLVDNMQVLDLVTGIKYEVSVSDMVNLTEVIPEGEDREPKTMQLPVEAAMKVLKVLYDPRENEVPDGYTVADGVLLKDGEPATAQGQLEFIDVLTVMAGEIILTAKTKDKTDGKVEIFAYRPLDDKFLKLTYPVSAVRVIEELSDENRLIAEITQTEEKVALDDEGEDILKDGEKVILVDTSMELMIHTRGIKAEFVDIDGPVDRVMPVENADGIFAVESDSILTYDEYGCGTRQLKDRDRTKVTIYGVDADIDMDWGPSICDLANTSVPGKLTAATKSAATGDFILRTENTLYVQNRGHNSRVVTAAVLKTVPDAKYLIDADIRNGSETYVLADGDYNVVTVKKTKTYDRGDIITVE